MLELLLDETTATVIEVSQETVLQDVWHGSVRVEAGPSFHAPSDVAAVAVIDPPSPAADPATATMLEQALSCTHGPVLVSLPRDDAPARVASALLADHAPLHRCASAAEIAKFLTEQGRHTMVLPDGYIPHRALLAEAERGPGAQAGVRGWYAAAIAPYDLREPALGSIVLGTRDPSETALEELGSEPLPADRKLLQAMAELGRGGSAGQVRIETAIRHHTAMLERTIRVLGAAGIPPGEPSGSRTGGPGADVRTEGGDAAEWRRRAEAAEQEAKRLRRKLDEAMRSESMRVGKAVTAPARAVARGLRRVRR